MLVELQGEPTIDAITFANACVRMKGAATSIDLQTVTRWWQLNVFFFIFSSLFGERGANRLMFNWKSFHFFIFH